jgi:hypothetical protein
MTVLPEKRIEWLVMCLLRTLTLATIKTIKQGFGARISLCRRCKGGERYLTHVGHPDFAIDAKSEVSHQQERL